MAAEQLLVDAFHRVFGVAVVDTDDAQALQDSAKVPFFEVVLVTGDTERTRARHLHHGPVDKTVVVTDKQHRTVVRDVAHVEHANLVTGKDEAQKRTDERLRKVQDGPVEHADRNDCEADEVIFGLQRRVADQRRVDEQEHHEHESLDHVGKRDDPARVVGARVVLQKGIHGHEEHAAEDTDGRV